VTAPHPLKMATIGHRLLQFSGGFERPQRVPILLKKSAKRWSASAASNRYSVIAIAAHYKCVKLSEVAAMLLDRSSRSGLREFFNRIRPTTGRSTFDRTFPKIAARFHHPARTYDTRSHCFLTSSADQRSNRERVGPIIICSCPWTTRPTSSRLSEALDYRLRQCLSVV